MTEKRYDANLGKFLESFEESSDEFSVKGLGYSHETSNQSNAIERLEGVQESIQICMGTSYCLFFTLIILKFLTFLFLGGFVGCSSSRRVPVVVFLASD